MSNLPLEAENDSNAPYNEKDWSGYIDIRVFVGGSINPNSDPIVALAEKARELNNLIRYECEILETKLNK